MATHATNEYQLEVFWDHEFKGLDYIHEPFNDPESVNQWISQGYQAKICGAMADMRHRLPSWNHRFIEHYDERGWKDIGVSYYRMDTGTVMPVHSDLYRRYVELFNLQGQEYLIRRALVLLEGLTSSTGLVIPHDGLTSAARAADSEVAKQLDGNDEFATVVSALEQQYDQLSANAVATPAGGFGAIDPAEIPNADAIAAQVEEFLAGLADDGDGMKSES